MKALGKALKEKVGGALAMPAKAYYGMKGSRASSDAHIMREARKYKGAPNTPGSDAFKTRTMADAARMRRGAKPIY